VLQPGSAVLVSGPAGFGKTTLLSEFVDACSSPTAWLSLDEADNDPMRFWNYLIRACQLVKKDIGETTAVLFGLPQPPPGEAIVSILINDLAVLDSEFVLILDDLHAVQNEEIHRALSFLLDHQPANFHLVASTRVDPPWALARMRARNQLIEIRTASLRFTSDEAAEFLDRMLGFNLPAEDAEALETHTEGWVAGLQLAALSMRGRSDISGFIKSFTGSHLYVAEYLIEEVFKNQSEDTRKFLLETSILPQLTAGLCEAVSGCTDGQSRLSGLVRANAFVIPMDDDGTWFRYHQLFKDLLNARLHQTAPGPEIMALHEKAAVWFENAGMYAEAIEHFLLAEDYTRAMHIISRIALGIIMQGNIRTLESWLKAIPNAIAAASPEINMCFAWLYLLQGSLSLATPYLNSLKRIFSQSEADHSPLLGQWFALQAQTLYVEGKADECIAAGNRALELLPEAEITVRTLAQLNLGTAYQQLSNYGKAAEIFEQVARDARTRGDYVSELVGISGRARMVLEQGKLHLAFQVANEGLERIAVLGKSTPFSASLYGEIGQIYFHWHKLDLSKEFLQRSVQIIGHSGFIDPQMYYRVMCSRIHQMEGHWQDAAFEMHEVEAMMQQFPPAMIRENIISQQVRVALAFDQPQTAQAILEREGFGFEGTAWMAERAKNANFTGPFGLLFNSALRLLLHKARTAHKQEELKQLVKIAGEAFDVQLRCEQVPNALETLLLRSQMHAALKDPSNSLADVKLALDLAEPEGFVSMFLEEGLPAAEALATLLKSEHEPRRKAFLRQILDAFPHPLVDSIHPAAPPETAAEDGEEEILPLVEKLSKRELEVLGLIAAGDSNQAIAEKLFITVSAVKKHTSNIFGKMNVSSRTQAIACARRLGLLPSQ